MNAHRMDQETVERLLVGPVAYPQDGPEALVQLLTAVRAAPRPHELTGEGAALQAFRLARAGALSAATSRPERRVLAGLLRAKVALAALLAAAATGGVALAAATGTLPGPLGGADGATTSPSATANGRPSPTTGPDASPTAAGESGLPPATPALVGLCTAYRAEEGEARGRALETARFAELVSTAGGREKVPGFCDRLLAGRDDQGGPDATARPGRDTGRPGNAPSTPAHRPSDPPVRR
ncbi:hypothetical protein GA0070624_2769 [Micromonospora rhizosphaerae]|uniref:Uncharacterized protein n=1 Tax=Micromonospora rhizosphaerae TaxID=568872 RepID=A0A1C6S2L3_9ACTN|nr:hypothetical protein [Micromonospora rhizosphaerae]SCL23615.1 hypothetical protein GA0070624_2769 [Micromonospora rhizosphaerae]